MKTKDIWIGITFTLAAGIAIYLLNRKTKMAQRRIAISDAGYETAGDLLYPMRSQRLRR
jgi:hypothetical protein